MTSIISNSCNVQGDDYDLLANEKDEVGVTAREIEANRRAHSVWE